MKILHMIFSLSSGGAERLVVDLCNELAKENEVYLCVILSDDNNDEYSFFKSQVSKSVNYINLGFETGINFLAFLKIFKLINKIKPDIVHTHLNTMIYMYVPAALLSKRIRFIHTLHSVAANASGFKWQKDINRIFFKKEFIVPVVISKQNKQSYKDFYCLNNAILIENGVAIPKETNEFDKVKKEIDNYKTDPNDKVFIHIGRYSEVKNQSLLINVFNRLLEQNKNNILIIIGREFDTEKAVDLVKRSKKGIYYLGTKRNVSDYLLNSDAFVLTSLYEGLPISLLEAMALGVIPVCTPAGGIPNVVLDESIGYVSKDFSEMEFYTTLDECIRNMPKFNKLILQEYFINNFSISICTINYMKLYESNNV